MPETVDMQRFDALLDAMLTKPEPVVQSEPEREGDTPEQDEG